MLFPSREELELQAPEFYDHVEKFGGKCHSKGPTDTKESKTVVVFVAAYKSRYENPDNFDAHKRGRNSGDYFSLGRVAVGNGHTIPIVESAKY